MNTYVTMKELVDILGFGFNTVRTILATHSYDIKNRTLILLSEKNYKLLKSDLERHLKASMPRFKEKWARALERIEELEWTKN